MAKLATKNPYEKYLQQLVRNEARTKHSKRAVGGRDGIRCFCCGFFAGIRVNVTHHIKPVAKGGERWRQNLVTLCPNCHALVHYLSRFWYCTVYQLRDSVLHYKDVGFGRAFKLALIATEEVTIEDDKTIWPRTIHRVRETLQHAELHELLFAEGYFDPQDIQKWENS